MTDSEFKLNREITRLKELVKSKSQILYRLGIDSYNVESKIKYYKDLENKSKYYKDLKANECRPNANVSHSEPDNKDEIDNLKCLLKSEKIKNEKKIDNLRHLLRIEKIKNEKSDIVINNLKRELTASTVFNLFFESLNKYQKELYDLHVIQGCTGTEIAARLNRSKGTVSHRISTLYRKSNKFGIDLDLIKRDNYQNGKDSKV